MQPTREQLLERDVDAILANVGLMDQLTTYPNGKERQPNRAQLLSAWTKLSDNERQVWRLCYGLHGEKLAKAAIAERLGLSPSRVGTIKATLAGKITELIWPTNYFPGLDPFVVGLLGKYPCKGITRPEWIYGRDGTRYPRVRRLVKSRRWGPHQFRQLEEWLLAHDYPPIADLIEEEDRQRLT